MSPWERSENCVLSRAAGEKAREFAATDGVIDATTVSVRAGSSSPRVFVELRIPVQSILEQGEEKSQIESSPAAIYCAE